MRAIDNFSKEEMQAFSQRSDMQAWLAIVVNWGIVAAAFYLVAVWPNPLTILVSLLLIGGRQLGFGALMHECGHNSLFKSRALNQWVGKWLAAGPVLYRIDDYMSNHLEHHRKIGTLEDPDLGRYQHYPVSKAALRRKFWRDLTGRTTLGFLRFTLTKNAVIRIDDGGSKRFDFVQLLRRFHAAIISNLVMIAVLWASTVPQLYLLWIVAYFSFYMLFSRLRNLAEHAVVPNLFDEDPLNNTRTTLPRWWERLTVAPNSVNYHLEHHLFPSIPKYRLAAFHCALHHKGLLDRADIASGYGEVVRRLIDEPELPAVA
ncbi:MAG: fatty acid desaturase family protein [Proteobacteria bacterium]|nr:fatty acid desaturase family protein [Pseudomonadota bacterium]